MTTATRPRVSVVLPGKDAEDYVADSLTSLTRQLEDPRELEVIVVDDGSTDSTADVVETFTDRLPHLTVLSNPRPTGLASARNQGLKATTGRYVAYLDADDWLAPGRLAAMADAMDHLGVGFVRTDHTTVTGRRRNLVRAPQARRDVALDPRESILPVHDSTMVDYPYAWAGMFDRTMAEDGLLTFPDGLHTAEDRPWIWNLFLNGPAYAVVDVPTLCYRRGLTTSLTSTYDRRQLDVLPALEQVVALARADREPDLYTPKIVRTSLALISHHMRRSRNMKPADRRELRERSRAFLGSLPVAILADEVREMTPERARSLHGLLPSIADHQINRTVEEYAS